MKLAARKLLAHSKFEGGAYIFGKSVDLTQVHASTSMQFELPEKN
jgi:hypothetical protein